jgi:hypothetical protein
MCRPRAARPNVPCPTERLKDRFSVRITTEPSDWFAKLRHRNMTKAQTPVAVQSQGLWRSAAFWNRQQTNEAQVRPSPMTILPGRSRVSPEQSWAPSIAGFQPEHEIHVGQAPTVSCSSLFSHISPRACLTPHRPSSVPDRLIGRDPDPLTRNPAAYGGSRPRQSGTIPID